MTPGCASWSRSTAPPSSRGSPTGASRSTTGRSPRAEPAEEPALTPRGAAKPGPVVLTVRGLTVRHHAGDAVRDASFALRAGEVTALVGPNGAGKSSLLAGIALPDAAADIALDGTPVAARRAVGGVALVPDASDDLFVCATVAAECRRTDRHARTARRDDAAAARCARGRGCRLLGLAALAERHPLDLSAGERRCLALALQLSSSPRVLLVDEPTRGLDPRARELVAAALARLADGGAAVLVATHDRDFAAALADSILPLHEGRLGEPVPGCGRDAAPVSPYTCAAARRRRSPLSDLRPRRPPPRRSDPARRGTRSLHDGIALGPGGRGERRRPRGLLLAVRGHGAARAGTGRRPVAAFALAPLAILVVLASLDGTVRSAHTLALLGILAAIGAAIRIVGTGVGGVEAVFILLILAGRVFGARFGLLLGVLTIALSSIMWGGIGPWTPFQMFACAWVGAGAGLLPRRVPAARGDRDALGYGVVASYAFGLLMNLWFWPFAVGTGTGISYEPGAPIGQNLASFVLYSLVTSTLTWDTLRARQRRRAARRRARAC